MSHFSVAVITDTKDTSNIAKLLAPYSENLEVSPEIYLSYDDAVEELTNAYKEEVPDIEEKLEDMATYKEYAEDWYGYNLFNQYGDILTTYNPNSKWDWYVIGGRWQNSIPLVNGQFANTAKIKDINMAIDTETYNRYKRIWEVIIEDAPLQDSETKEDFHTLWRKEYYIEKYKTKEKFAEENSRFSVFALLDETGWHETGEMGWFGFSAETDESRQNFHDYFQHIINSEEYSEKYMTIVDCHI